MLWCYDGGDFNISKSLKYLFFSSRSQDNLITFEAVEELASYVPSLWSVLLTLSFAGLQKDERTRVEKGPHLWYAVFFCSTRLRM